MSEVRAQKKMAASPERVWEVVMDPQRFPEWVTIHRELKSADGGPLRTGVKMEQVLCIRGVSFTVKWELRQCEQPRVAEWAGKGPAGSRATTRYELHADGEGGTLFDYTNDFNAPGGVLGRAASRVLVGEIPQREAEASLERLRSLVEKSLG